MIPKEESPTIISHFRPIVLCNVLAKVETKVVANRLKSLMPKLVNENQRSFIPGRQASDNVVLAQEIHSMRKERGKKGYLAFKIDLEKADDKIEWSFLEKVLGAAGLEEPLIKLIMFFVSFTMLSVI